MGLIVGDSSGQGGRGRGRKVGVEEGEAIHR